MKPSLHPPTWQQQALGFAVGMLGVLCIAGLDKITGPNIHIGVLYWVPVGIAAWLGGRVPSYVLAIMAIAFWYQFSFPPADHLLPLNLKIWNVAVRVIYYPAVAEMVIYVRNTERRLERLVANRTAELRLEIAERERAQAGQSKLAAQVSDAEDAERRRLAYDIHDALSQMLGVIKLNLETAVAESPTDSQQYARLSDVVNVVNDLIRQTRDLTFDLHPAMLEDLGLVPTLRQFADEFHRRTLAEVTVSEAGETLKLPSALASYLFRSTKELVSNSVRHGNAAEILITVHWLDEGVRIVVDDDGKGFDPQAVQASTGRRGLGLAGIQERLTFLGGLLRLESQPGQGTRVIMDAPAPRQQVASAAVAPVASVH
ncbi:MAG TPA: sensor histidine kinase [Tepidisphaeraceae bacterium]|nr:sensor histidine kinase [Tepidisphaeraceae bacterium]